MRAGVVCSLGRGHASNVATAEILRFARDLLLHGVGSERREQGAATWQNTKDRAERGTAGDRPRALPELGNGRQDAANAAHHDVSVGSALLEVVNNLGDTEHAHCQGRKTDALGEGGDVEGEALLS